MRGTAFTVALAFLLAGCSDGGKDASTATGATAGPGGTGTLAGLVVDEAVRPLSDANVTATGASGTLNATTGADGMFRFEDLAPGVYLVQVAKKFYSAHQQAVDVRESVGEPVLAKFQLSFQAATVPFADLYKFDGYFECGVAFPGGGTNGCANVNIVTGIMLCSFDLPCFNVTADRSVELIPIFPQPEFIQSELAWTPTTEAGSHLVFGLGAATREELQDGFADGYNFTEGPSPLMLTLFDADLEDSRIGIEERELLIQVSSSQSIFIPVCSDVEPSCGVGLPVQQPYTTFTHAFYGYRPPSGWLFTETGQAPPPPL